MSVCMQLVILLSRCNYWIHSTEGLKVSQHGPWYKSSLSNLWCQGNLDVADVVIFSKQCAVHFKLIFFVRCNIKGIYCIYEILLDELISVDFTSIFCGCSSQRKPYLIALLAGLFIIIGYVYLYCYFCQTFAIFAVHCRHFV